MQIKIDQTSHIKSKSVEKHGIHINSNSILRLQIQPNAHQPQFSNVNLKQSVLKGYLIVGAKYFKNNRFDHHLHKQVTQLIFDEVNLRHT